MRAVRVALVVLLAAGCSGTATSASGRVNVVAGENFYGDIAAQLGGDRVHVTSLISDPEADPHLYESDARAAAALAGARVVIKNGLGYDDFVDKLLGVTRGHRTVVTVADVLGVHGSDANPHLWYDIPRMPEVARAIAGTLSAVDPAGSPGYQRNLTAFDAALRPLTGTLAAIAAKHPHEPVAYTERVPEYLLVAAGLDVKTPPGFATAIEDGNEPDARDTAAMNDLIKNRAVNVLLYNSQATSPVTAGTRNLAKKNGVPVVAVTETIPHKGEHYQDWQLSQARALLAALGG
jgi:zinc/manganese transport system substrate-binding protein